MISHISVILLKGRAGVSSDKSHKMGPIQRLPNENLLTGIVNGLASVVS